MNSFAKLISFIGHPLLMPLYTVQLLFTCNPYMKFMVNNSLQWFVLIIVFVFTFLLPLINAFILLKFKLIDSLYMTSSKERLFPFFFTLLFYLLAYKQLKTLPLPESFYLVLGGAIAVVFIALIITFFWKISIHALGIGGLFGAFLAFSQRYQVDQLSLIIGILFFAGLIGFSRLQLKAHQPAQVYTGFLIGTFIEWGIVFIF
jgi:membrane-associated phospholipid phosphatase